MSGYKMAGKGTVGLYILFNVRAQTTMPNPLKDLVSMVAAQAKRPLQPSTSNRFSPAKQNVASGPIADLTARIEDTNAKVTVEQQQEQAKMDAFVFMNMLQ
ncbi:hypothetical protein PsorP6_003740 [Peronosclerospora sorghi]|uniref:Uncharacterized protein n=1 Tax=Peronosclerospora sorghi TaxID=230839 RepID=A0ACC0VQQ0_9STRA|nr:hypothetical protein PsorP6_003740 [Peronosclerospora sorghi]